MNKGNNKAVNIVDKWQTLLGKKTVANPAFTLLSSL